MNTLQLIASILAVVEASVPIDKVKTIISWLMQILNSADNVDKELQKLNDEIKVMNMHNLDPSDHDWEEWKAKSDAAHDTIQHGPAAKFAPPEESSE